MPDLNITRRFGILCIILCSILFTAYPCPAVTGGDAGTRYTKENLERLLRSKAHLVLKYAAFDPLAEPPPPHPLEEFSARGNTATRYYIIQFKDRIKARWRAALEKKGIRCLGYLPGNAYIGDLGASVPDDLKSFAFVRWFGPYLPAFKIAPSLAPDFSDGASKNISLTVTTFPTADAEKFFNASLWSSPGVVVLARLHNLRGQATVHCRVTGGAAGRNILSSISALEGVAWIEPFEAAFTENDHSIWVIQSGDEVTEATPLFDNGLTGIGQVYGSVDIGVDTDACQMRYGEDAAEQTLLNDTQPPDVNITDPENKIITYYLLDGALPYDSFQSGYHGTHTTGCAVGDKYVNPATQDDPGHNLGDGMAPGARMVFQDAGGLGFNLPGLSAATPFDIHAQAYHSGARIHNNSYGTAAPSTDYSWIAQETDTFLWAYRDYLVFFSAGNQGPGPGTVTGFGKVAKNTVAAGATRNGFQDGARDMWSDSSHGPTADFRLKPELVAPGESIMSATESLPTGGLSTTDPPNNNCTQSRKNGTSFASATAAGGGLLVRQYFTDGYYPGGERNPADTLTPSNALIKAIMINSCINMPGAYTADNGTGGASAPRPTNGQGWGRITLDRALYFTGDDRQLIVLEDAWNGETENQGHGPFPGRAVTTGRSHAFGIEQLPHPRKEPLMISLVWSDPAGATGSGAALVNNLDLLVFDPDGGMYAGNANFHNGFSQPASLAETDVLNPVENVFIQTPETGTYTILVRGASVPGNGTSEPFRSDLQGYALVVSGKDISQSEPVLGRHILTGPGPGAANDARIRVFDGTGDPVGPVDFLAYTAYGFGANVAGGDVNGDGVDEMVTGPGKDISLPPLVRSFGTEGTPLPGGEFMAYGIQKYGCVVACGDLSGNGIDEVLTGPGPGDVFGPHVRGWAYANDAFSPLPSVSFLAYGTKKFGVKPARGDVDGDGYMEILTAPGPGAVFGPHIRGWDYDNDRIRAISAVSFFAYGTRKWGANAGAGDIDGDGFDEILTGPGPGAIFGPHIRGWNFDGSNLSAMTDVSFFAYGTRKMGARVAAGDIDLDGFSEILSGPGPGAMFGANVRAWNYDNDEISPGTANFFAYDSSAYRFGVNVSTVSTRGY